VQNKRYNKSQNERLRLGRVFKSYSAASKTFNVKDIKGSQQLSLIWRPYFNAKNVTSEDAKRECSKSIRPKPKTELMAVFQLVGCMQEKGFTISITEEIILNDRL